MRRAAVVAAAAAAIGLVPAAGASAAGNFVIGNQSAVVGSTVTFWGAQWWKLNSLSGGPAPASFKGYASTLSAPLNCGIEWISEPGNSSEPPAAPLPQYIDVLVASSITKSGPTISGNAIGVVLVETNEGYGPDPGHAGTGKVLEVLCPAGAGGGGNPR